MDIVICSEVAHQIRAFEPLPWNSLLPTCSFDLVHHAMHD